MTLGKWRQRVKRIDPGFAVVLAITFIAIWPFLSRTSLPEGTDAELHIFRLAELSYLLRGGELYPRWAPNFYHGYGYPIFNYYAPLTYYLGFLAEITPWFDAVAAVKFIFILGMLFAGLGIYGFVRDNWGRLAGYVATAVFLYAPYVQYIDPHARGVLPESFSFGVFALALWALDRLHRSGQRWPWIASVFLIAGAILSHNLMGLLFYGILFAYAFWLTLLIDRHGVNRRKSGKILFSVLFLGLGVAAFFWLPVVLERDAVNLNTLIGRQDNYDFHTHFLSLKELVSPSLLLDWGASEPKFRFNLGIAQWLLGGLGLVVLIFGKIERKRVLLFFALMLACLLFLMLPWSTFIWETIPFLPYFQFPWRLLGAVAAMLAILAGAGLAGFNRFLSVRLEGHSSKDRIAIWSTSIFVALPIIFGFPLSQPTPWPDFGEVNHLRMTLIENTGRWLGTTSTADYVPSSVDVIPKRESSVVQPIAEGLPPDRINYANLPDGTSINTEVVSPLTTRYYINTPRATLLRLFQFDFPGWQARVNGQIVATELGRPEGLIVVPVPEGKHVVEVSFDSTPARNLASFLSLISFAATLLIAWKLPPGRKNIAQHSFQDWGVLIIVFSINLLFVFFLEPFGILRQHSSGQIVEPAQNGIYADFGEQIALLGYDISPNARPGETLDFTLYWKAQDELPINYQVFVHLLGPQGLYAQSDKLNPGDFPTKRWPLDKYVRDEHQVMLPADLPSGTYEIAVGVWVQSDGWRLPLLDSRGNQIGDRFPVYQFMID